MDSTTTPPQARRPKALDLKPFADLPDDALARKCQIVPAVMPVSDATWWRMVKKTPALTPVHPAPGITAWHVGRLREWMRTRDI